jgi:probable phosphoglycerate mutase
VKTELWILRHGETEWNLAGRLQGSGDSPLTERGQQQGEAAAVALAARGPIDALYSSDLGRAERTARTIGRVIQIEPRIDPGLREISYGGLEGRTWAEIERDFPEIHRSLVEHPATFAPPGGESRQALQRRVVAALTAIAAAHPGQRVAVVTHGGALTAFLRAVVGIPLEVPAAFRSMNCALHHFDYEQERFRLITWGLIEHLGSP